MLACWEAGWDTSLQGALGRFRGIPWRGVGAPSVSTGGIASHPASSQTVIPLQFESF